MLEKAVVERILEKRNNEELVLLKKTRPDACHHCTAKVICGVNSEFFFKALNNNCANLKEGDLVEYQLPNVSIVRLSFILYSVPLLFFLLSVFLLMWIFPEKELFSLMIALLMMLISFFGVGLYDRKRFNTREDKLPKVQKILNL